MGVKAASRDLCCHVGRLLLLTLTLTTTHNNNNNQCDAFVVPSPTTTTTAASSSLSRGRQSATDHRVQQPFQHHQHSSRRWSSNFPGADIEQPPIEGSTATPVGVGVAATTAAGSAVLSSESLLAAAARGKVNEIDFCMAPADASLSRAYGAAGTTTTPSEESTTTTTTTSTTPFVSLTNQATNNNNNNIEEMEPPLLSLTRALNNASNRAVRRILLARSWPSEEALNLSLRQVAAAEREAAQQQQQQQLLQQQEQQQLLAQEQAQSTTTTSESSSSTSASTSASNSGASPRTAATDAAKCPVPRPILNVLMRNKRQALQKVRSAAAAAAENQNQQESTATETESGLPFPRSIRTNEEYVADQLRTFGERYRNVPGYEYAEAYLESILTLATLGKESSRVEQVIAAGIYDEAYQRVLSVLQTAGVVLEEAAAAAVTSTDDVEFTNETALATTGQPGNRKISSKLVDQDICLSMIDRIAIKKGIDVDPEEEVEPLVAMVEEEKEEAAAAEDLQQPEEEPLVPESESQVVHIADESPVTTTMSDTDATHVSIESSTHVADSHVVEAETRSGRFWGRNGRVRSRLRKLRFWKKPTEEIEVAEELIAEVDEAVVVEDISNANETAVVNETTTAMTTTTPLTSEDLGGVLLSSKEPTMTRQLNVLANIVRRALLFGGDQELLVLSETLDADRQAFVERWYPHDSYVDEEDYDMMEESRAGVQFLNCLIALLRECYYNGVVTDLQPPAPVSASYANAYERLVATAVELGSGYLKPAQEDILAMPKPRTAQEELGRFAVWETEFRRQSSPDVSAYPEDLEGQWEIRDEIGGETIGVSTVSFEKEGSLTLAPPLEGLRWRLDPGPTHLDTCTFQVLSSDGTILQYRGFIDRGARLEARFSKRPITIRGSVMFQMRDGTVDYYKDMLPINYRQGTTKFVMTKVGDI